MSRIIYVPLEHIEGRYTTHMDSDIIKYLNRNSIPYVKIMPTLETPELPKGMFLNAPFTSKFKALQLAEIAGMYERNEIDDNDVFFFSDLWFPGIESIAYQNYFTQKSPKITGLIHAGSFTDTDFVRDLERWAKNFEDIIFDISSKVFCSSEFLRDDIIKKRMVDPAKLIVAGLPVDYSVLDKFKGQPKEDIIIFNGRLCDEKQPWLFDQLEKEIKATHSGFKFIKTQEENLSRDEYYSLLARSKVIVSYALQENFGFGVAEAAYLDCVPVLPNRLVYPELYNSEYLYNSYEESVTMVRNHCLNYTRPNIKVENNCFEKWFR